MNQKVESIYYVHSKCIFIAIDKIAEYSDMLGAYKINRTTCTYIKKIQAVVFIRLCEKYIF